MPESSQSSYIPLPGTRCCFFKKGLCLRNNNPQMPYTKLAQLAICTEEKRFLALYDAYLEALDREDVPLHVATQCMQEELATLPLFGALCQQFKPDHEELGTHTKNNKHEEKNTAVFGKKVKEYAIINEENIEDTEVAVHTTNCYYFHKGLCIAALPPCLGVCAHFKEVVFTEKNIPALGSVTSV